MEDTQYHEYDLCVDMCVDMCSDICLDICIDMRVDMRGETLVGICGDITGRESIYQSQWYMAPAPCWFGLPPHAPKHRSRPLWMCGSLAMQKIASIYLNPLVLAAETRGSVEQKMLFSGTAFRQRGHA